MATKNRSARSNRWLQEHFRDRYVQEAQKRKLRSRSWFKLDEIQRNDKLLYPGMVVVDLGAAPGGWSQYVATQIGNKGHIFSCDVLPMIDIGCIGIDCLQGDFCDPIFLKKIFKCLRGKKVQVVLSDMAPNMSGVPEIDIPKSMYLVEAALQFCQDVLVLGGSFLVKVFQGEGFDEYLKEIRLLFSKIKIRKPDASRSCSREVYIVAKGYKL